MDEEREDAIAEVMSNFPADWFEALSGDEWTSVDFRWRTHAYRYRAGWSIARDKYDAQVEGEDVRVWAEGVLSELVDRAWRAVKWDHPNLELKLVVMKDGAVIYEGELPMGDNRAQVAKDNATASKATSESQLYREFVDMMKWSLLEVRTAYRQVGSANDRVMGVAEHMAGMRADEMQMQADVEMHRATEARRAEMARVFGDKLPLIMQMVAMMMGNKPTASQQPSSEREGWVDDFLKDLRDEMSDEDLWSKYEAQVSDLPKLMAALQTLSAEEMKLVSGRFPDLGGLA